ncbi:MAG: hypothetical protein LWW93_09635 [Hyphomicrobiales bacterium]|nr:hypothetical protein [Hyphomicrobiales bacterium]
MAWQGHTAVRCDETRRLRRRGGCFGFASLRPEATAPLTPRAHDAILAALDDEHRAQAFYTAVLDRFPGAMPFRMIVAAEARQADALAGLLRRRGLAVPQNVHLGSAEVRRAVPATATCACRIAVTAEEENVALYEEELMPLAKGWADVERVFRHLAEASRDRHLPAFRHWAEHHHHRGGTA